MVAWPSSPLPSAIHPVQLVEVFKEIAYDSGYTYTESQYSRGLRKWELDYVYLTAAQKNKFIKFLMDVRLSATIITWTYPYGFTIVNAPQTTPITVTTAYTHNLYNGDMVVIAGVTGNTAANGTFTIGNVTATSFQLIGSSGIATYDGGGTAKLHLPNIRVDSDEESFSSFGKTLGPDIDNKGVYTLTVTLQEVFKVDDLY
jgi:hypothetical protein